MEQILQQILVKTLTKIMEYYEKAGLSEIYVITEDFKEIGNEMLREILCVFIENADKALCDEAKAERKAEGFTIKERGVPRSLYTALGEIEYSRTHFKAKGGGYAHILDRVLGVNAYERVDSGIGAQMVNNAASVSFGKSAAIATGGKISRQTAWKRMQEVGEVAYVPTRSGHTPETLHIFADEDHVSLQDGKNAIVPLVTCCSGKEVVCKGRNALIDPVHIQGYGLAPDKHWGYVYAVMAEKYDLKKVKQVFIYGDGARWIKAGFDVFGTAIHVLDAYHLDKRLRALLSGEICSAFAPRVRAAVDKGDRAAFQKLHCEMRDAVAGGMEIGKGRQKKLAALRENASFLLAHWEAILNNRLPGSIGSCTEAQVSHVLSKRLSRDPMGWSKAGLSKLAMVRVFRLNGGNVMPCDVSAGKVKNPDERTVIVNISKYEDIIAKQYDDVFKGWRNWRWFEKDDDSLISRKPSGTKTAVDALIKMRDIG